MNKNQLNKLLLKLPRLFFGFFLCALGISMMLQADLGLNPWGILHKGITLQTGITFGKITQITGLVIIVLSIPLKIIPGIGTLLNMYFIGLFIDIISKSGLLASPESFWGKLGILILGIFVLSEGIYFYLSCGLGAGPRDGLMLGLMKKFNKSVTMIRTGIEGTVLIIGVLLGGPLGIGTVIIAATSGLSTQLAFKLAKFDAKSTLQRNIRDEYVLLFQTKSPKTKLSSK